MESDLGELARQKRIDINHEPAISTRYANWPELQETL
jgi:hypothetical protein